MSSDVRIKAILSYSENVSHMISFSFEILEEVQEQLNGVVIGTRSSICLNDCGSPTWNNIINISIVTLINGIRGSVARNKKRVSLSFFSKKKL